MVWYRTVMGANDSGDVDAYLLSSKYRRAVLRHLATEGRATPKDIADAADIQRPHVSRALGELREKGVVELRVSEDRTVGRYYGLTEVGEAAWDRLRDEIRHVDWERTDPETPGERAVVDVATSTFEEALRTVSVYDGEEVRMVYADDDVVDQYSEEELQQAFRIFVFEHALDAELFQDRVRSELLTFSEYSLLRVRTESDVRVAVTVDRGYDGRVQPVAERLAERFEAAGDDD